jgi:hypothetical protein
VGIHKWDEITGRGSYDIPGSKAAQSWLRKKDKESLTAARQAIASRMMAGWAMMAHGSDFSPFDALQAMQNIVESASGKHPRAANVAYLAAEQMLDFARLSGDEIIPDWRSRSMLESMMPASARRVEAIAPTVDSMEAHGWTRGRALPRMTREEAEAEAADDLGAAGVAAVKQEGKWDDFVESYIYEDLPLELTGATYAAMQRDYREWAAMANANELLGRTDWTASDIQAMNIARYRTAMNRGTGPMEADTLLDSQAVSLNFELEPHPGSDLYEAFPNQRTIKATKTREQYMDFLGGLDQVNAQMARWWAANLGEISGVSVVHVSVGSGKRRGASYRLDDESMESFGNSYVREGEWEAFGPQISMIVTGSPESIKAAVVATGATFQQREVIATSVMGEIAGLGDSLPPGWASRSVTDFVLPSGMPAEQFTPSLDERFMANLPEQDPGRMMLERPDGTRIIRVLHESDSPWDRARGLTDRTPIDLTPTRGFEDLYGISPELQKEMDQLGIVAERNTVRSFTERVDYEEGWPDIPRDNVRKWLDKQGEFVDAQGTKVKWDDGKSPVLNLNTDPNKRVRLISDPDEWQSEIDYKAGEWTDPWLRKAEANGYTDVVRGVRNRYRGEAISRAGLAYWEYLGDFLEEWRARDVNLSPPLRGYHMQYTKGKGVRAATNVESDLDASIFLTKKVGPDSIPHELMHSFVPHLEDSMIQRIREAYSAATGNRLRKAAGGGLSHAQEEWLADEFIRYATTGKVATPALQSGFNLMGKLVKEHSKMANLVEATPEAKALFDELFRQPNASLSAVPFDPDEYRIWSATRQMLLAAEDEAHTTHYFRRGRNLLERSINHPYLGYYPASYMWGKVVPELVKFLVREPFGLKAPMAGYALASHVGSAVLLQMNTDEDFRKWVEEHPEFIRFVQMMMPGTPWDIPVNAPAWVRRTATREAGNVIRQARGDDPASQDIMGTITDSAGYAFGLLRSFDTFGKITNELFGAPEEEKKPKSGGLPSMAELNAQQWQAQVTGDVQGAVDELAPRLQ